MKVFSTSLKIAGWALVLSLPLTLACTPQDDVETSEAQPETEVAPSESAALAEQVGESLYFYAQFQEQLKEGFFVVTEDESRGWGDVIVLNRSDRSFQVPSDVTTPMWIYGTVETLTPDLLQEYQVAEAEWPDYEGQPFIAAEEITLAPAPDELVNNAEAFLNQHVTVYGKVEPIASATDTFILQDPGLFGGKGVILIEGANANLSDVIGAEKAVVSGVLRPYVVADLQDEYGLTWELDLQNQLEADFEQSPVIVVQRALPAN
jgi:hypothetical protein